MTAGHLQLSIIWPTVNWQNRSRRETRWPNQIKGTNIGWSLLSNNWQQLMWAYDDWQLLRSLPITAPFNVQKIHFIHASWRAYLENDIMELSLTTEKEKRSSCQCYSRDISFLLLGHPFLLPFGLDTSNDDGTAKKDREWAWQPWLLLFPWRSTFTSKTGTGRDEQRGSFFSLNWKCVQKCSFILVQGKLRLSLDTQRRKGGTLILLIA